MYFFHYLLGGWIHYWIYFRVTSHVHLFFNLESRIQFDSCAPVRKVWTSRHQPKFLCNPFPHHEQRNVDFQIKTHHSFRDTCWWRSATNLTFCGDASGVNARDSQLKWPTWSDCTREGTKEVKLPCLKISQQTSFVQQQIKTIDKTTLHSL